MEPNEKDEARGCCCGCGKTELKTAARPGADEVRDVVRRRYAAAVKGQSCCGSRTHYSREELAQIPKGADLGLGSGNPIAAADLRPGEKVLDLGSGAGVDVFLAARKVGPEGHATGVDMTMEMIEKARANAAGGGFANVEFHHGLIESPPVSPRAFDVVVSNCVINLSPDKDAVFRSAFEALRPGGRLVVSDMVFDREPSAALRSNLDAYCACVAGADPTEIYLDRMRRAGFEGVEILSSSEDQAMPGENARTLRMIVRARRPAA
jgi:SAM-dependent methyltransferase